MNRKLQIALRLLESSPSIFLHVDTRDAPPALRIPERLLGRAHVVLHVGHDMSVPIPDLQIGNLCVYGTLSFHGQPHLCVIPWETVKAIAGEDGKGVVFDAEWAESLAGSGTRAPAVAAHPSERPYLRRVK